MSEEAQVRVFHFQNPTRELYGDEGKLHRLMKIAAESQEELASAQGLQQGEQQTPFDFAEVINLKDFNPHHSTCLETKVGATVGLGFRVENEEQNAEIEPDIPSKESQVLDPLCEISFHDVLNDSCEDYWQVGNGYIEVVRRGGGDDITGLHHLPTTDCKVVIEDEMHNRHYKITSTGGTAGDKRFARFGDKEDFLRRNPGIEPDQVSEVIHLRRSSSRSRVYGYPDWLSAIPSIELVQALHQFAYDFFLNRGVPEFMLFVKGVKIGEKDWEKIEAAVKATIGIGNSHKTMAINLPDPNITIQVERLGIDGQGEDHFREKSEALATQIVSAHRVPPLLAGIQIPGKLGSTNELPNALRAFQQLVIRKAQNEISTILRCTLGNSETNGGLGLQPEDFKLRRITDVLDLQVMDTSARMRQTEEEANAEGRDLEDGLEKELVKRLRKRNGKARAA